MLFSIFPSYFPFLLFFLSCFRLFLFPFFIFCSICTVPDLETDRWKYYNCIIPGSCSALRFFLFLYMCLVLVQTKFQCPTTWTFCLRSFVMYRTKVIISLFEQQKLTSLNIRIASFLRVAAPCGFICLFLWVLYWFWQNFSVLRLKLSVWAALKGTGEITNMWKLTHEKPKLSILNIKIASSLRVAAPCGFFSFVCMCLV
jgi:hypothetical protein